MKSTVLQVIAAVILTASGYAPAHAADTPEPAPTPEPVSEPLAVARAQIKAKQWDKAVTELQRVNLVRDADWHNLLGYTHRKKSPADLVAAERHYAQALRLNPQHRGALEYSGELYLMKGDLAQAEQRLATLQRVCTAGCEELNDLKQAVARYKANGNKPVAQP
jgi:Flp pilus assembly protein TadD